MLSCKDVSTLVSESLDRKLPLWKRLNLWLHLCMCGLCWRFRKDLTHLHNETQELADQMEHDVIEADVKLSAEARERIKQRLASQQL